MLDYSRMLALRVHSGMNVGIKEALQRLATVYQSALTEEEMVVELVRQALKKDAPASQT
jgi:hypothetical protein